MPFWLCPWVLKKHEKSINLEISYAQLVNLDTKSNYKSLSDHCRASEATEADFNLCSDSY